MIKRIILSAVIFGSVSACTETKYLPSTVNFDVRTAQNEVRTLLMGAPFFIWHAEDGARVSDVRFRSDGMALLITIDGSQTMHACYYGGMNDLHVAYTAVGHYGFGGPQYAVLVCQGEGAAWFDSESEAKRLADALFSLKNSPG